MCVLNVFSMARIRRLSNDNLSYGFNFHLFFFILILDFFQALGTIDDLFVRKDVPLAEERLSTREKTEL